MPVWAALYSPSNLCSIAVSLPKAGETILSKIPENRYHRMTAIGPCQPTSYDSFLENKIISRVGFEKLLYIMDRELAHFSISAVSL
jgi:hypothetical protein